MSSQPIEVGDDSPLIWKDKYLQLVNEVELDEKRHLDRENEFFKQVLRLLFAFNDNSSAVEKSLSNLRDALRQVKDNNERRKLILPVIDEVVRLKQASVSEYRDPLHLLLENLSLPGELGAEIIGFRRRAAEIQGEQEQLALLDDLVQLLTENLSGLSAEYSAKSMDNYKEALTELFEWLSIPEDLHPEIDALLSDIEKIRDATDLKSILKKTASLVSELQSRLQLELKELQLFLSAVTNRLAEVEAYFGELDDNRNCEKNESRQLSASVNENIETIRNALPGNSDVNQLRSVIESRLEIIESSLASYMQSTREHQKQWSDKVHKLNQHIVSMKEKSSLLQKRLLEEHKKAKTDVLTGVPNRLAYNEYLKKEFSRWNRHGKRFSICVIDVDRFKLVNDSYGHKAGDKVLKTIAEVCSANIRDMDFMARYGGEEFVLLLPETSIKDAEIAANQLRKEIQACKFHYAGQPVSITISCGASEVRKKDGGDSLFKRADNALYAAKQNGRNRVEIA